MTDEQELRDDPNTAELETLTQLPGIGPELAKRSSYSYAQISTKELAIILLEATLDEELFSIDGESHSSRDV